MGIQMDELDVLVGGGGYVGLSLAVALKQADPGLRVAVVDMRPREAISKDPRASAVAAAASRMLDRLGVWSQIAPHAQPMMEMIVTDSRLRDAVRPVFLTFDGEVEPGEPFAHMVPNGRMVAALADRAEELGVELIAPDAVSGFTSGPSDVEIRLASGAVRKAKLLVAADGVRSKLRDLAGIGTVRWEYDQSGIVTTVAHERPHEGRAEEHFLPSGPFAILPLTGNRSSLVWTERRDDAERLVKGDDFTFELELERRFGHHLGKLSIDGPRHAFPLGLTLARSFVQPRLALAGDAAHGIHPIAGQGLNLGLRDVGALVEVFEEALRLGLDLGDAQVLARYERWRGLDSFMVALATDGLTRLFGVPGKTASAVRRFGMGGVQRIGPLKDWFMDEARGITGDLPELLRA